MVCVLATILLCIVSSVISQPVLLGVFCGTNGNYANNSAYQKKLNSVLSTINSNAQDDYWFYNISSGGSSDSANAIALCRGDLKQAECSGCLNDSTHKLTQLCPSQKEALIWYDKCMLRYSNSSSIFGTRAADEPIQFCNVYDANNANQFNGALNALMTNLSNTASSGDSRRKYASGKVILIGFEKIYGLVQCTPDLTRIDCSNCLNNFIGRMRTHCNNKIGGRVMNPSCAVRFETKEFFYPDDDTAAAPPPPPSTYPPPAIGTKSQNRSRTIIIVVVSVVATVVLIALICIYLRSKKPRKNIKTTGGEAITVESLQYNFSTIKMATDDFSEANKLGEGGFGAVYKGTLLDGQEIAVKRLSMGSGQGDKEFKTEVTLVAKLQHRDRVKRSELDWGTRYKIIRGIAKGLLYLHEDSRLRIIHRGLKASNILLDAEMNPKIADFGLAKLFVVDQTQGNTSRIVGTQGYMSPEYLMHGHFSVKSDVYSFGVLVLEIVSGNKNTWCRNNQQSEALISYAWKNWMDGTISNLIDPTLTSGSNSELTRCIQIGLLSVQENASDRPTMASIVMMLNSYSITLPIPSQPSSHYIPQIVESVSINDVSITEMYPR